jgi:prepilin-type N-terminal cleavage/methylation domain-containing protein
LFRVNKNIKAFTLSEMMVALLITAIVVGLAFSVLQLVQKHLFTIESNYKLQTKRQHLEQSLWIDFSRAQSIKLIEGNRLLCENELNITQYEFQDDYVVKRKDTFEIGKFQSVFFFEEEKRSIGVVDAVKIEFVRDTLQPGIFVFKRNDAKTLIHYGF